MSNDWITETAEEIFQLVHDSTRPDYEPDLYVDEIAEILRKHAPGWVKVNDALEWAAQQLETEVKRHLARNREHNFCEDYGCSDLEEFAAKIRAGKSEGQ